MDDLHKPLKGGGYKKSRVNMPLLFSCALGAVFLGFLGFVFLKAEPDKKLVVALNDEAAQKAQQAGDANKREAGGLDLSKVKPLSPLMPIDGEEQPSLDNAPAFQPQEQASSAERFSDWVPLPDLIEQSEFGPLPQVSGSGLRPLDVYSRSHGTIGANRVALIVGGLGISQTGTQAAIEKLPVSVTLGFSPFGNSLQRWMQMARKKGHEVILQLPMEPLGYPAINPGPRTLTSKAGSGENLKNLRWALARMTNYPLVMNYLGGGMANNVQIMRPILEELQQRGVGFIDDGSIQASQMLHLAQEMRLPHVQGNLIVDAARNTQAINSRLKALEGLSRQRGYAIGSATAFPESVSAIVKWIKTAEKRNILIVPVSNLVKDYTR